MKIFLNFHLLVTLFFILALYWKAFQQDEDRIRFLALASFSVFVVLHPIFSIVSALIVLGCTFAARSIIQGTKSVALFYLIIPSVTLILLIVKYGGSLYQSIFPPSTWAETHLIVPLGVSYFIFRLIQYLFDCYRGTIREADPFRLGLFLLFPPTLPAGPIETYQSFYSRRALSFDKTLFFSGANRILLGYAKKILLVSYLFQLVVLPRLTMRAFPAGVRDDSQILPYLFGMFVNAYLDLSAYSDLAIGFSALFGFRIGENFNRPFLCTGLASFWKNWHISLSNWCRNNVYFPVYGWRRSPPLALYSSMIVMGLWHHLNFNWMFWGLYHGAGLHTQTAWNRWKKKSPKLSRWTETRTGNVLSWFLTMTFVTLGYAFVSTPEFPQALRNFGGGVAGLLMLPIRVFNYFS